MNVGFTGSRNGMTPVQLFVLQGLLMRTFTSTPEHDLLTAIFAAPDEFHHGDCVGADAQAHKFVRELAMHRHIRIVGHPPDRERWRAFTDCDEWWPMKGYIERDHDIVNVTEPLIATPNGPEVLRSGTWATIRYARTLDRPGTIIYPDGKTEALS